MDVVSVVVPESVVVLESVVTGESSELLVVCAEDEDAEAVLSDDTPVPACRLCSGTSPLEPSTAC